MYYVMRHCAKPSEVNGDNSLCSTNVCYVYISTSSRTFNQRWIGTYHKVEFTWPRFPRVSTASDKASWGERAEVWSRSQPIFFVNAIRNETSGRLNAFTAQPRRASHSVPHPLISKQKRKLWPPHDCHRLKSSSAKFRRRSGISWTAKWRIIGIWRTLRGNWTSGGNYCPTSWKVTRRKRRTPLLRISGKLRGGG